MKQANKIFTLCVALILIVTVSIGATAAYQSLTADEFAAAGSHKIDVQLIHRYTDENGNRIEQTEPPILFFVAGGYSENAVRVKNGGNIDTFNRVLVAIPADLDDVIDPVKGDGWELTKTLTGQTCEDGNCNIYIFTLLDALEAGETSDPAITGVRLDDNVQILGDRCVFNGKEYDFSNGLALNMRAQAIQSAFFQNPADAFEKSGAAENPWAPSVTLDSPVSATALNASLRTLPTGTKIGTSVTNVIFGKRDSYREIMESCYGQPVDKTDPNGPWAYYQASTDSADNTTWTVYILSDSVIYLPEDCDDLFKDMTALTTVDTANCDTRFVTSMHGMFQACGNLTYVDVSEWDTSSVTSMHGMFKYCSNLTYVDVSNWNMSKVTSTSEMFYKCGKINNLDVSKWDTSRVANMSQMFNGCSSLTYLNTTNWNMTNMRGSYSYMFTDCKMLTAVDVAGWVTKDTKSISYMFLNCSKLESIDVSGWDTSNVTAMDNAFNGCSSVTELNVSKWNTAKVTTTWQMFQNCSKLTSLNLTGWNTANVNNTSNMFYGCSGLTELDISSFNVKNVTKAVSMFNNCKNLTTIYVSAAAGWEALAASHATEIMFAGCSKLVGEKGTKYISQYGALAKIDGGTSAPGYFTDINNKPTSETTPSDGGAIA